MAPWPPPRSTVTSSNDPLAPPLIQPHYLSDEDDLQTLIAGIQLARTIAHAHAFDPFRGAEIWPGTEAQSSEAITDFIRSRAESLYHPVGTCKMGRDPLAVTDDQLRVHGMERLRVVDASIMPTLISGNTNAATIMIAEKAADMIKQER